MNIGNDAVELYVSKVKPLVYQRIFRSVMAYISGSGESYQSITQRVNTIADSKTRFALMAVLAKNASIISEAEANQAINAAPSRQMMHVLRALLAGSSSGPAVPSYYLNLTIPGGSPVTIADGQARGTITSTYNAVITASMSPSRTTGVAPLYVNFDMTGTTSTLSTNPTHECFFATDFGDSGAGTWANGVQSSGLTSKNAGYGPVTGHVYETPGTYYPSMTVLDGDGNLVTKTGTIVVQDPDTVYAGTNTICLSHSGNFTGAPSGSSQPVITGNTDMYSLLNTYKASNKRILFCKADNWTSSAAISITSITGMTVGGYGTGVARAFGSGTLVNVDASAMLSGSFFGLNTGCENIIVQDLKVLGGAQTSSGITLNNSISGFLASKLEFRGMYGGFSAYPGGSGTNNEFDQHCIYECVNDDLYGYAGVDLYSVSASGAIGTPGVFTATGHSFGLCDVVQLTGTPPAGVSTGTDYFIGSASLAANTFTLSTSRDNAVAGVSIALSGTGACTVGKKALSGGIGAFTGHVRGGMMGCYFDNKGRGEQTVRFPFLDRAHINNNYFARPNQGKNVVKIHSFVYYQVALYSEKFVVQANVVDMRNGYSYGAALGYTATGGGTTVSQVGDCTMIMSNGGSLGEERVRNAIVESNYTYGCLGNAKGVLTLVGVGGPNFTVRNNIADFSMGDRTASYTSSYANTFMNIASVGTSTLNPTTGVRIYNNTLYSNMYNAESAAFVQISAPSSKTAAGAIGTPGVFTSTNHGFTAGMVVRLIGPGTIPAPLVSNTDYWISATSLAANTFVLKASSGGADLALSGSGTCEATAHTQVDGVTIKNNIWYLPHHNPANLNKTAYHLQNTTGTFPTNIVATNNTDDNGGITTSPGFVNTPPVLLTDWRPTAAWTINNGATVPVLRDFNNASRVGGTYDLGAVLP